MLGVILALTAAAGWGAGAVLTRMGLKDVPISVGTLVSLVASLVMLFGAALFFNQDGFPLLSPQVVAWFAMTGVVGYPLGRRLNFQAIHHVGAARATPVISASPLFAIAIAAVFTGEQVTLPLLAGAIMVVGGIALVVSSQR
jgi:drug/metabolite transporter (DMT)-like permease